MNSNDQSLYNTIMAAKRQLRAATTMPTEPPCPTCGTPPASLIEDAYATDLVPWWRYYAQKFNPCRLIKRKAEMRWIPMGERDQEIWSHEHIVVRWSTCGEVSALLPTLISTNDLFYASHWCPLPPLP